MTSGILGWPHSMTLVLMTIYAKNKKTGSLGLSVNMSCWTSFAGKSTPKQKQTKEKRT